MKTISCDIAVIGGGLGGCLVSMQLLQQHPQARVCIIEKKADQLCRGVAYAKHFTRQLLNVPVMGMSIDPGKPDHFYNWLTTHAENYPGLIFNAQAFVPRSIYGDYVEDEFRRVSNMAGERLQVLIDEAIAVEKTGHSFELTCKQTGTVQAKYLVLSTGNLPPADIPVKNISFLQSPAYVSNPWTPGLIAGIETRKDVLLIGSGLTAVDIVLALHDQAHTGNIYLLSRQGKFPLPHAPAQTYVFSNPENLLSGNTKNTADSIRNEIKAAAAQGIPWQSVMDAIRPWIQKSWQSLDPAQKKIFLSRLRPYWEIHRHRMPVPSLEKINRMKEKGQLVHYTGIVENAFETQGKAEVVYNRGSKTGIIAADLVINCTGPENNFRKHNMPLLVDMMHKGYATSDALNLGIACDAAGHLLDATQQVDRFCFCMGHLRKGTLWETTAVRELREQAREISGLVIL